MNVQQLKKALANLPDDIEIWISPDVGVGEGGTRMTSIKKVLACNAGLDGDDVSDEYVYTDGMSKTAIKDFKSKGYKMSKDKETLSKEILLIHDSSSE